MEVFEGECFIFGCVYFVMDLFLDVLVDFV